ncbi:hypothetical protein NPX13_g2030 [Xylaria arbuscula]|uniref:Uncharacterized protein n=1 Tax=Xylaria arbuscula TaxID=114810 RepID=A0A9W8NKX9_9PEZI|nr:hypothetical protein NPX13_g2030 [Xylaria arbuscula]
MGWEEPALGDVWFDRAARNLSPEDHGLPAETPRTIELNLAYGKPLSIRPVIMATIKLPADYLIINHNSPRRNPPVMGVTITISSSYTKIVAG